MNLGNYTGKILYAFLFCILLPGLLILWSVNADKNILLPLGNWKVVGIFLSVGGFSLLIAGMANLWRFGNGLPMNAFPPEVYVLKGVYRFFRHPIYAGFCITCAGISLLFNSAGGFYLITPVVILSCIALLYGYEKQAIENHFGKVKHFPLFGIPESSDEPCSFTEKFCSAVAVFIPWLAFYELLIFLGPVKHTVDTAFGFEKNWGVIESSTIIYIFTYPFMVLAPFFLRTKKQLRYFVHGGWAVICFGMFLQIVLPFSFKAREFVPETFFGKLIITERTLDGSAGAFPSFHVLWAFFAGACYSLRFPKFRLAFYCCSLFIALSCMTTGAHSFADVLSGFIVFLLVMQRMWIWKKLQHLSEQLANSWRAWHIGNFRIISHSFFAGIAGMTGIFVAGLFIPSSKALLIMGILTVTGSCLWGQFVEGSQKLLRPFGYYGGLLGGISGAWICKQYLNIPLTLSCAAFALAAPWIQAAGRLRCLVQGCCHGKKVSGVSGIRYTNEHTRACKISGLKGEEIHNTQLYSLLWNIVTGILLFGLWYNDVEVMLIIGLYFIFNGLGRFVEESYRGEVQTKIIGGLRLYQWIALIAIFSGAWLSTMQSDFEITLRSEISYSFMGTVLFSGLFCAFALGMDFPKSNLRFSRLSG